jgi:dipeptidyl aminopeptidase/acylaminoacyl peptidase
VPLNQRPTPFPRRGGAVVVLACVLASPLTRADDPKGLRVDGEKFAIEDGKLSVRGILVKPAGNGPFPAVLISHGLGSTGEQFGRPKAREFVKWGFVCIAPDYAHSDPKGDRKDFGASAENLRRARKCLDILQSLPEVDPKRMCAYGNSMGAFVTIGLAAEEPDRLVAAAITAGGISPVPGFPAPSNALAGKIRTPFCVLHGTKDTTVPAERSRLLEDVLRASRVECERHLFEGVGHDLHVARAKEVNSRIEGWFRKYTRRE